MLLYHAKTSSKLIWDKKIPLSLQNENKATSISLQNKIEDR